MTMKTPKPKKSDKAREERAKARSQQRVGRPLRGAEKDPYKEAWMAGARAGTEVAYDLIMRSLENMARTLGIKRRKRPTDKLTHGGESKQ